MPRIKKNNTKKGGFKQPSANNSASRSTAQAMKLSANFTPYETWDRADFKAGQGILTAVGTDGSIAEFKTVSEPLAVVTGFDIVFPHDTNDTVFSEAMRQFTSLKRAAMGITSYTVNQYLTYCLCALGLRAKFYEATSLIKLRDNYTAGDSKSPDDVWIACGLNPVSPSDNIFDWQDKLNTAARKLTYLVPLAMSSVDNFARNLFGSIYTDRPDGRGIPLINMIHHVENGFASGTPEHTLVNLINDFASTNSGAHLFYGNPEITSSRRASFDVYVNKINAAIDQITRLDGYQAITADLVRVFGSKVIFNPGEMSTNLSMVYDSNYLASLSNARLICNMQGTGDTSDRYVRNTYHNGAIVDICHRWDGTSDVAQSKVTKVKLFGDSVNTTFCSSVNDTPRAMMFRSTVDSIESDGTFNTDVGYFSPMGSKVLLAQTMNTVNSPFPGWAPSSDVNFTWPWLTERNLICYPLGLLIPSTDTKKANMAKAMLAAVASSMEYAPRSCILELLTFGSVAYVVCGSDTWNVDTAVRVSDLDAESIRVLELASAWDQDTVYKPITVESI